MRNFTTRIQNKANALALRARMALSNQRGDFYISDAVKIIIAVVLGACDHFDQHDMEAVYPLIQHADIVLAQLETNLEATEDALRYAKLHGCKTILKALQTPISHHQSLQKSQRIINPCPE